MQLETAISHDSFTIAPRSSPVEYLRLIIFFFPKQWPRQSQYFPRRAAARPFAVLPPQPSISRIAMEQFRDGKVNMSSELARRCEVLVRTTSEPISFTLCCVHTLEEEED